jgi:hypothetical protein
MHEINYQFLKSNLDQLQVSIVFASYTKCQDTWCDLDFLPDYNKLYFICEGEGWVKIGGREYYPAPGQLMLAKRSNCVGVKTALGFCNQPVAPTI